MKASDLFLAMGDCAVVSVLGTLIKHDEKMNDDWTSHSSIHRKWKGRIIGMSPESAGGLSWIVRIKPEITSAQPVTVYVRCEEH